MSVSSYRTILRSSAIMGAASILNILSGLFKMKVAAVLLGPAGVGLVGLFQSLIQTGAQVGALGLGTVGARQIAAANAEGGPPAVGVVRRSLFWATLGLAVIGALVFLAFSGWIAASVLNAPELYSEVAWLSIGVALSVASGSQGALLTGMRRIGDLARVQVLSGLAGAVFGVLAVWIWGRAGVVVMVVAAPLATFALGHLYVSRLGPPEGPQPSLGDLSRQWRGMAALGIAFMASGVVTTLSHLAVRTIIQRELGTDSLGQFQAAWVIGMTYLGFVLTAMTNDFFPRLSAAIKDHPTAIRLVNEQTEVTLILCAPPLLAMLALAPWVVELLYTDEFGPAAHILRWQLLGDILKVISWPLGYILLAAGAGKTFVLAETIGMGTFVLVVLFGLPIFGVTAAGVGYLIMYTVYLPAVFVLAMQRIGFKWSPAVLRLAVSLSVTAVAIALAVRYEPFWGALAGLAASLIFALTGIVSLAKSARLDRRVGTVASWLKRALPVRSKD